MPIVPVPGSEFTSVPVVDVGGLFSTSLEQREAVATQVGKACRDVGFFYVKNHGVDEMLQTRLEQLSREFFAQSVEVKNRINMGLAGKAWRGFFKCGDELTSGRPDMKEGIYFGAELPPEHPNVKAGIPMHGANLWPDNLPELRPTVSAYMAALTDLGHRLTAAISLSLGLPEDEFRRRFTGEPLILFRIFNYPAGRLVDEQGKPLWGVGEHTDYGLLTILKQDASGGLEVQNRSKQWVAAPPLPGTFIINIGDMLERMTHGLYRSTPHRAVNSTTRDRLSFPFFFDPGWDAEMCAVLEATGEPEDDSGERWDGRSVHQVSGTYGSYILGKVGKAFPELGQQVKLSLYG